MPDPWRQHRRFGPPSRPPPGFGRRFFVVFVVIATVMVGVPALVGVYVGSRFPQGGPAVAVVIALVTVIALLAIAARVFGRTIFSARQLVDADVIQGVDAIYSTPFKRTKQTAQAVGDAESLPIKKKKAKPRPRSFSSPTRATTTAWQTTPFVAVAR